MVTTSRANNKVYSLKDTGMSHESIKNTPTSEFISSGSEIIYHIE